MTKSKKQQKIQAETPFGTLDHPLLGNDPSVPRSSSNPGFDPEGRVMHAERVNALLPDTAPNTLETFDLGSEAIVTQIATSPNVWIVSSNDKDFSFSGDVVEFLTARGVTIVFA